MKKRILILKTPIKVAKDKKENMTAAFVTEDEYLEYSKNGIPRGINIEYKKGLGSMNDKEYAQFFKLKPLNKALVSVDWNEKDIEKMLQWVGDDSDFRKEAMQQRIVDFDPDKI